MLNRKNVEKFKNTRRPETIKAFLSALESIWLKNTDLRFIQLLRALNIITEKDDGFHKEVDDLLLDQSLVPQREVFIVKYWQNGKLICRRLAHIENSKIGELIEGQKEGNIRKDSDILKNELEFRKENNIYI